MNSLWSWIIKGNFTKNKNSFNNVSFQRSKFSFLQNFTLWRKTSYMHAVWCRSHIRWEQSHIRKNSCKNICGAAASCSLLCPALQGSECTGSDPKKLHMLHYSKGLGGEKKHCIHVWSLNFTIISELWNYILH